MINKHEKVCKRVKEMMEEFIQDEVKSGTRDIYFSPSTVLEWFEFFEQIYGITE
jgi:hypothetical protein